VAEAPTRVWEQPVRGSYADPSVLGLNGLDRMRAVVKGRMPAPPIHHLTGLVPVEAGPGTCTFSMPATPWFLTLAGLFNAGVMAWVADAPLGSAILTALPPGRILATSDLSMNFLRPVSPASERLVARARVIHAGNSLGLSEVMVEDGLGRLLGHGTSRCFLFEPFPTVPEPPEELSWTPPDHDTPDPYLLPAPGEVLPQEFWDSNSGLEMMRALVKGELPAPPLHYLLGGRFVAADEGEVTYAIPATEWLASPARAVYGGAIALIADVAIAGAVQTTVGPRTAWSPLDLKVNFLRPVFPDGRTMTARGRVIHRGRTLAVATGEIRSEDGKKVAVAHGSAVILPDRPWTTTPVVAEEEPSVGRAGDAEGEAS
jgi:uncharacterized protein (TIGR00369 family)